MYIYLKIKMYTLVVECFQKSMSVSSLEHGFFNLHLSPIQLFTSSKSLRQ